MTEKYVSDFVKWCRSARFWPSAIRVNTPPNAYHDGTQRDPSTYRAARRNGRFGRNK